MWLLFQGSPQPRKAPLLLLLLPADPDPLSRGLSLPTPGITQPPAYGEGAGEGLSLALFIGPVFIWQLLQQLLDFARELAWQSVCPLSPPSAPYNLAFQVQSAAITMKNVQRCFTLRWPPHHTFFRHKSLFLAQAVICGLKALAWSNPFVFLVRGDAARGAEIP